jgi:hypothetical protein
MFEDRSLVIATMHKKELAIAPILESELRVKCVLPTDLNTDLLGTFSGEIERKDSPIDTAREKCLRAMELTGLDLAVASEGSFGAHPTFFFAPAGDEFLMLLDKKNNVEIIARELTTKTNFNAAEISSNNELIDFISKVNFPTHAVIVRKSKDDVKYLHKGISDLKQLIELHQKYLEQFGSMYIETDMRALYNPTRMESIKEATHKLVEKIKSVCPECNTPGFDVDKVNSGLPCSLCGTPTNSTLSFVYACKKCQFEKVEEYPHKKQFEDPMYCDSCNP